MAQVIKTIQEGADLAIAGLYGQATDPTLGCFLIQRSRLLSFKNSKSGHVILFEVLGTEGIKHLDNFAEKHG